MMLNEDMSGAPSQTMRRDKPAFAHGAFNHGLTKYEYALIHVAAALASNFDLIGSANGGLAARARKIVDTLFVEKP